MMRILLDENLGPKDRELNNIPNFVGDPAKFSLAVLHGMNRRKQS
jgi:hypothetical protein